MTMSLSPRETQPLGILWPSALPSYWKPIRKLHLCFVPDRLAVPRDVAEADMRKALRCASFTQSIRLGHDAPAMSEAVPGRIEWASATPVKLVTTLLSGFWGFSANLTRGFALLSAVSELRVLHSAANVAKIVLRSRQFFTHAVDGELLPKSPISKVKAGSQKNPQRLRFISRAVIDKAIEHATDVEWKLIIAFPRYGGVRAPSEILALQWNHASWEQSKVLIRASKTEHHVGNESRLILLFPELKSHLLQAFEQAEERYRQCCMRRLIC
jgi:integrase